MANKFKVGDIIRISNINDISYKYNNFYKIVATITGGNYSLKSLQTGKIHNMNEFSNIKIDRDYRLATEAEKVLYVSKIKNN